MSALGKTWRRERAEWTRPVTVAWWRLFVAMHLGAWGGVWLEYSVVVGIAHLVAALAFAGLIRGSERET